MFKCFGEIQIYDNNIYIPNKIQKLLLCSFFLKKIIDERKVIIITYKCLRIFTTTNFHAD